MGVTQPSGNIGERKDILSVAGIDIIFLGSLVIIIIVVVVVVVVVTVRTGDVM